MISRISGRLVSLGETAAFIEAGPFEYEVLVPDFVRRQLQSQLEQAVSLRTINYIDGNPQKGSRMTPRLIGFLHDAERQFFDMIGLVDGVGVKKALQAMVRPVREVATAIEEQDVKFLSTLPGVGPAVAERIIAKLRRKMARFALMIAEDLPEAKREDRDVLNESYEALVALGHSTTEARAKIEQAVKTSGRFKSVEDLLQQVYSQQRPNP